MDQLFGTDGIRGFAGRFPLDERTIRLIGRSLAQQISSGAGRNARFLSGRDTRESGTWIEAAFHSGVTSAGAVCDTAGVITTPGVAHLTGSRGYDAGIVISASHNPYPDNGIKIFSPSGKKIGAAVERQIEIDVSDGGANHESIEPIEPVEIDQSRVREFAAEYLKFLGNAATGLAAGGIKIVIDCANGAASNLAPDLFASIGGSVVAINNSPNGRNINENCGSLHLDDLRARVVAEDADLGVAFDGDADRALFVDENGNVVDGDATLWIMARHMQDRGFLASGRVVATVMSNVGLEVALQSRNIELIRTDVGDKYVLDELLKSGSEIRGEQSGHIIFPATSLVGDGMLTALHLLCRNY